MIFRIQLLVRSHIINSKINTKVAKKEVLILRPAYRQTGFAATEGGFAPPRETFQKIMCPLFLILSHIISMVS